VSINHVILAAAAVGAFGLAAPAFAPDMLRMMLDPTGPGVPSQAPLVRINSPGPPSAIERPTARTVLLRADRQGQFEATASINGVTVPVIVDTGATTVALSADTARRIGILPPQSEFRVVISTANGTLNAAPVMLNQVTIGGITVPNVQAVIVPGKALPVNLLGMSFLSRLSKYDVAGDQLTLRQ
jgi:aspartyl protease family protein